MILIFLEIGFEIVVTKLNTVLISYFSKNKTILPRVNDLDVVLSRFFSGETRIPSAGKLLCSFLSKNLGWSKNNPEFLVMLTIYSLFSRGSVRFFPVKNLVWITRMKRILSDLLKIWRERFQDHQLVWLSIKRWSCKNDSQNKR